MNGAHDMGGMQSFGPIDPEPEGTEPIFHAAWERRIFALTLAAGALGRWNIDKSRFARESQPPARYLDNSYYQTWLAGLEKLLVENGLLTPEELANGTPAGPAADDVAARVLQPVDVGPALRRGDQFRMPETAPPQFAVGQPVRVKNRHPLGHTRAPRYVRGHVGVVDRQHGTFVFADANASGRKEGQHCYSVRFEAPELWGPEAPARDLLYVDLWDDHLEPA